MSGVADKIVLALALPSWCPPKDLRQLRVARFPSIRFMVEADPRGRLPIMGVAVTEDQIQQILRNAEQALGDYATRSGTVAFELSAHVVSGRRP